jgi:hypothetical protein
VACSVGLGDGVAQERGVQNVVARHHTYPNSGSVQTGVVYAVEFAHRMGRDLINMAKKRTNIIPIIEDARYTELRSES